MLTVLSGELQTTLARRLDAVIDPIGDSPFLLTLKKKRQEFDAGEASLPSQTSTNPADTRHPAVFSLSSKVKNSYGVEREVATVFSFLDTAGENLGGADRARDVQYLAAASGLVLLLNPFAFNKENQVRGQQRGLDPRDFATEPIAVLRNITEALREHEHLKPKKKIRKPIAVVLGMIDAFFDEIEPDSPIMQPSPTGRYYDEQDGKVVHDYVAALIAKWGGDNILRHLDQYYETYRLFAISALGAQPNYSTKTTSSRGIQPHRVSEPLLWLMACRGLVTVKKA
ncbi:hypothetical protein [Ferrimicrobium sp.]|uniref:hypothetical protein n=1 Tax=Ferrimicrobium sp. TaxID=2926050 RepID=UPI00261B69A9|nr:hypothetical protein [Ferrimicrobium sp.]